MSDKSASASDRGYDSALERTVPSEQFDADGIRRQLKRTTEDVSPGIRPQSFLLRTETDTNVTPAEDTTGLGGFGETTTVPAKLLADDRDGGSRFEVLDEIGTGGTARVFAVHDRSLNRTIALKLLRGKRAAKPGVENRFINEARVTAMLEHPNIMPVHDIGTTDEGRVYFTMKNIAGVSLGDAIRAERAGKPVPDDFRSLYGRVSIIVRLCDALSFAHDRGYLHQDVKPDNIMLGEYGEVLLLDWGCALTTGEAVRTDSRAAYGTPAYMSPEQARREAVDERCDVYCAGATLFHALFLRHPTWSSAPEEFWEKKRRGNIDMPTDDERRRVPAPLIGIALKALAPDPAQRYQTVALLARDLARYQAGLAVSAHRETPFELFGRWYRKNRRVFWIAAIAAATVMGTGTLLLREKIQQWVTWRLVYAENFENDTTTVLRRRWHASRSLNWYDFNTVGVIESDAWHVEQGALHAYGRTALGALTFARPIAGDLRIEWDVTALNSATNLNCFIAGDDRNTGYAFHVGEGGSSTRCILTKGAQLQVLAETHLTQALRAGKTYHFRMEREGKHIRLTVDGTRVLEYRDPDILHGIGHRTFGFEVALDNHLILDNITVYHHPLPLKVSPLEIPQRFLAEGQPAVALAQFRELAATYPGTPVATQASYYAGMCLVELDSLRAAARLFRSFVAAAPRHELAPLAMYEQATILRARGAVESADSLCERLMAEHGRSQMGRAILLDMNNARVARFERESRSFGADGAADRRLLNWLDRESRAMRRWSTLAGHTAGAFRETAARFLAGHDVGGDYHALAKRFRGHTEAIAHLLVGRHAAELLESMLPIHRDCCAEALVHTGAFQRVLDEYPDQHQACAQALNGLGRFGEVIERYPQERGQVAHALLALGRYEEILADYADRTAECAEALWRRGHAEEVLDRYLGVTEIALAAALHLGRVNELAEYTGGQGIFVVDIETGVTHKPDRAFAKLMKRNYHRHNAPFALLRALSEAGRLDEVHQYLTRPHLLTIALCDLGRHDTLLRRYPENRDVRARVYEYRGMIDSLLAVLPERVDNCVRGLHYAARYSELRTRYPYHRKAAARQLLAQNRYQAVVDSFPDQRLPCALALIRLGRGDDVLTRYPDLRDPCARALLAHGELETARHRYPEYRGLYADYLLSRGRYADIVRDYPDRTREYALALVELGRRDELPFTNGQYLLSRRERHTIMAVLAIHAYATGRRAMADSLMAARPVVYRGAPNDAHLRFGEVLLEPLIHALDGDRDALRVALDEVRRDHRYAWAQRLRHELEYLTGDIDDERFLSQPYRLGAATRLVLLNAIRADLEGHTQSAIDGYRRALAEPLTPTISAYRSQIRCAAVRHFALWRLASLGGDKATEGLPRYAFGAYIDGDLD